MCRCKTDHGGRRCPSSQAPYRSARERAWYAARKAATLTTATVPQPRPAFERSPLEVLRDQAATVADLFAGHADKEREFGMTAVSERLRELRNDPNADPETIAAVRAERDAIWEQVDTWSKTATHAIQSGHAEQQIIALGHGLATRAEEIAGVTAEQVAARYAQRLADAQEAKDQALAALRTAQQTPDASFHEVESLAFDQARTHLARVKTGFDEATRADMAALADGYQRALAEVRPLGGQMAFDPKTKKQAAERFTAAAQLYPSDWVDASNARTAPYARQTEGRAHYIDSKVVEVRKKLPLVRVWNVSQETYERHFAEGSVTLEYSPVEGKDSPETGRRVIAGAYYEVFYPRRHKADADGRPIGKEWTQVTYTVDGVERTTWRRPVTKMQVVEASVAPELTVDTHASGVGVPGHATAVHETAHRMEASVPMIGRMEAEFLRRRTTDSDGTRQRLQFLFGSLRERARPDDFVHPYIGREYDGAQYHEVLSVGTESLFGGAFGGLVGAREDCKADLDHRAFVLGVLASARPDRL